MIYGQQDGSGLHKTRQKGTQIGHKSLSVQISHVATIPGYLYMEIHTTLQYLIYNL
jgi:hypothetical protein